MDRRIGRFATIAALFVTLLGLGVSGSSVQAQAIDAPPALRSAIEEFVEGQGHEFAGDCREAQSGELAGQFCYTVLALNDEAADVAIGLVLSNEIAAFRFRNDGGTWEVEPAPGGIVYGNKPPADGGFGTFAFGGGTFEQLLEASGCPAETAVFFYNKPDGSFAVWIPGSAIGAVNAEIMSLFRFPGLIPEGTIFIARCK